nr:MAG TPA: hypothetical protein [Caudoviricetes sp.]
MSRLMDLKTSSRKNCLLIRKYIENRQPKNLL